MDIWHRVGRIVRFSNLGTLLFFTLNILLIVAVFGSSGSIVELICIYFFTVAISLSPLGEMCLAAFAGASDIKRVDIKLRVVPLVQYVLDKAKENTSYCPKKVKVKIIHDPAPNAFALGRQTLCITDGLLSLFLVVVDSIGNMVCCPCAHLVIVILDDQFHNRSHSCLIWG